MAKKNKKGGRHVLRTIWLILVLLLVALIGFMLLSNPDLTTSVTLKENV